MISIRHKGCGENCCHAMECCPRGVVERIQNYRYKREVIGVGFIEYWKWEFECLIGMHKAEDEEQ